MGAALEEVAAPKPESSTFAMASPIPDRYVPWTRAPADSTGTERTLVSSDIVVYWPCARNALVFSRRWYLRLYSACFERAVRQILQQAPREIPR